MTIDGGNQVLNNHHSGSLSGASVNINGLIISFIMVMVENRNHLNGLLSETESSNQDTHHGDHVEHDDLDGLLWGDWSIDAYAVLLSLLPSLVGLVPCDCSIDNGRDDYEYGPEWEQEVSDEVEETKELADVGPVGVLAIKALIVMNGRVRRRIHNPPGHSHLNDKGKGSCTIDPVNRRVEAIIELIDGDESDRSENGGCVNKGIKSC